MSGGGGRLRAALVVAQVALALVPLVGAGLMLRTVHALQQEPLGFEPQGVTLAELLLEAPAAGAEQRLALTFAEVLSRVRGLPGVQEAGLASTVPLWGRNGFVPVLGEGEVGGQGREPVNFRAVSGRYFEALRIPLREGRTLTGADGTGAPPVMVVNQAFARRYTAAGRSALGQRARVVFDDAGEEPLREIVGVVGDVRHEGLAEAPVPEVYLPHAQLPLRRMVLAVRTSVPTAALLPALRASVAAVAADAPLVKVRAMPELVSASLERPRALGGLFGVLAALGLGLAAVGLYGVLAYTVAQRTRELGIRAALGAAPARLLALVLRQGLALTALGIGVGLAAALLLARLLGGLVHGIPVQDPLTFLAVPALLLAVALLASSVPARRALRVPPHEALRADD